MVYAIFIIGLGEWRPLTLAHGVTPPDFPMDLLRVYTVPDHTESLDLKFTKDTRTTIEFEVKVFNN